MIEFEIKIGDFTLSVLDKDSLWLQHKDGEGMSLWNNEFEELIKKYFEDHF